MNNIKFKAWDNDKKQMAQVVALDWGSDGSVVTCHLEYKNGKVEKKYPNKEYGNDIEFLSWSGLFDDDGEEIYNHYIVKIQSKIETKTSYKSEVIVTHNGSLVKNHPAHVKMGIDGYRDLSGYCDYGFGDKHDVSCKIVGNIFKNPELLN